MEQLITFLLTLFKSKKLVGDGSAEARTPPFHGYAVFGYYGFTLEKVRGRRLEAVKNRLPIYYAF